MFATATLERSYLHITLFAPIFAVLVALANQAGLLGLPMRELTMIAMGAASAWCLFVRGLPHFEQIMLFGAAMLFSGLAFGLHVAGLSEFAPVLLVAPQALLLGVTLQGIADERQEA